MAARLLDIGSAGRQKVDRYELIGEIASGGMATVFLARLTGLGGFQRFVALKRLHPHLAMDEDFVRMFLDEARLAAGIHHPNVVPILEVGAGQAGYYLVMEYVEGDTLAKLLARAASIGGRLPVPIATRIGLDMLAGLHVAHDLKDEAGMPTNLVHRDVSPQNVLIGADGIARITDFGVARAASRLGDTRAGQLKGKIAYMAPEQASGIEDIDRRADIFASGIVIWEAYAQRRLFKAQNEAATLSRVMNEPVPRLAAVTRGVAPQMDAVIMKALERDPEDRFATCGEFADALERAAQAANLVASSRDLAAYVNETLGDEIAQQRDAVRAWIAQSDASAPQHELPSSPVSSVTATNQGVVAELSAGASGAGQQADHPPEQSSKGWWALAVLLFLGAAAGAVFVMQRRDSHQLTGTEDDVQRVVPAAEPASTPPSPPPSASVGDDSEGLEPKPEKIQLEDVAREPKAAERKAAPDSVGKRTPKPARRKPTRRKKVGKNPYEF